MIGKTYGSLIVINYDADAKTAKVRCECGNVEIRPIRALAQGRARICRECKDQEKCLESIKVGMERLAKLEPAIAAQVLRAYVRHLAACRRQKVRATRFAEFIRDALMDPDLLNEEETDQSFESRYLRSNPQTYKQYHRPVELL